MTNGKEFNQVKESFSETNDRGVLLDNNRQVVYYDVSTLTEKDLKDLLEYVKKGFTSYSEFKHQHETNFNSLGNYVFKDKHD